MCFQKLLKMPEWRNVNNIEGKIFLTLLMHLKKKMFVRFQAKQTNRQTSTRKDYVFANVDREALIFEQT